MCSAKFSSSRGLLWCSFETSTETEVAKQALGSLNDGIEHLRLVAGEAHRVLGQHYSARRKNDPSETRSVGSNEAISRISSGVRVCGGVKTNFLPRRALK